MFGHDFKAKHFSQLDPDFVPVNHGSYGATPDAVLDTLYEAMKRDYSASDRSIRIEVPAAYRRALKAVGKLVNAPAESLALVENATVGVNAVLRSFPFAKGDKVVILSTIYGACGNTVKFLETIMDVQAVEVALDYPISNEDIVAKVEKALVEHKPRIVVFDTITSMPGVLLPYQELLKVARKHGVLSLVDGAHCVGLLPIDLGELQPDFFVSNLHKWLYVPRACALLYVDKKHHRTVQTFPISHSYVHPEAKLSAEVENQLLISKFEFIGTKSFGFLETIERAIEFRATTCGGEAAINAYCFNLAKAVGKRVAEIWQAPALYEDGWTTMCNVELPLERFKQQAGNTTFDVTDPKSYLHCLEWTRVYMIEHDNTFVPWALHNNTPYARFSCQVYNELGDYEHAALAVERAFVQYFKQFA